MRVFVLLSLMLGLLFFKATAQESVTSEAPSATSIVSMTPEMSSSSVLALYSSLATSAPQQPGSGPSPGDAGSSAGSSGSDAGASGHDSGSITLSQTGMIVIIVVIVVVCIFGIASSVLWYLAKKRSWEVRKRIRSSARKVATALTPRRSTFPKDVHRKSARGLTKIDDAPYTPRAQSVDVEKANSTPKMKTFEMADPPKKSKWTQKK